MTATNHRLLTHLTGLLLLWLAVACLWRVATIAPSPDDAMFLSVPKNWLNGYGWATSYSEAIPFNPDFTAGPTLLLPAAALMTLFGNAWWIAGATGLLLNGCLLALCWWRIQRHWQYPAAMMLAFASLCIAIRPDELPTLIGYYTASLLFLLMLLIAFDPALPALHRTGITGLLTALALLTKPLALPAVLLFLMAQMLYAWRHQHTRATQLLTMLIAYALPMAALLGGWWWWRDNALAGLSPAQQTAWHDYAAAFFAQHGSGLHTWQQAQDGLQHILRNSDRNLFHIEAALAQYHLRNPFISGEAADSRHVVGILWLAFTTGATLHYIRRAWHSPNALDWALAALGSASLLYFIWFIGFAMAMSSGHAYFPVQWSLWLLVLTTIHALCQHRSARGQLVGIVAVCTLVIGLLTPTEGRAMLGLSSASTIPTSITPQLQARDVLLTAHVDAPLAGCGYDGYPRHLEYLLPVSQNFHDCYDMIEDHAQLDTAAYYRDNGLNPSTTPDALAHFRTHVGTPGLRFHFTWKPAPINFTLVLSLPSMRSVYRLEPILQACLPHRLYINQDVVVLACRDAALKQTINLDFMMSEIAINQRWYRTRLR